MKDIVKQQWREKYRIIYNPHFWIITCIIMALAFVYQAPASIINPRWDWLRLLATFEFKSNLVGSLFLIPFIYSAAVFWWKGILITWAVSMVILLSRIIDYSENAVSLSTNFILLLVPLLVVVILDLNRQWRKTIVKSLTEREETRKVYIDEVIKVQEKERNRVAREIHDEIIQKLWVAVNNTRKLITDELRIISPKTTSELEKNRDMIIGILEDAKKLSLDLRPGILDDLGLIPALRWQINQLNTDGSVEAQLLIEGNHREFSSEISTHLFRIVQESLNNVKRHAEATQVLVKLEFSPDIFNLIIQDNGKGFALSQIENPRDRLGIIGIQERTRLVGGVLDIQSELDKGTVISVQIKQTHLKRKPDLKTRNINN